MARRPKAVNEAAQRSEEMARKVLEDQEAAEGQPKKDLSEYLNGDEGPNEPGTDSGGPSPTPSDTDPQPKPDTQDGDFQALYQETKSELEAAKRELQRAEERYNTLRSKYDAEVPRLAEELRGVKERNAELEQRMKAGPQATQEPNEEVERIRGRLKEEVPEDVVADFEALVNALGSNSRTGYDTQATQQHETRIEALQEELQHVRNETRQTQLSALVPDWKEIDKKFAWKEFLQTREKLTGREYQDIMMEAWQAGEIARVAQFFNMFKESRKAQQPNRPSLEGDVQPNTSGDSAQPTARKSGANQRIWKMSEIKEINARQRRGDFRGREAELEKLRKKIEQAAVENRIDYAA